jgi:hypothetical protein
MRFSALASSLAIVASVVACGAPAATVAPAEAPPFPSPSAIAPTGPAGAPAANGACVGAVPGLPELEPNPKATIHEKAIGKEGDGRLCEAKAFRVKTALTVHRVWDGSKPESRVGRWWALEAPRGTTADYRRAYAICPEWSAADRSVTCKVKAGAEVVLGTGQSAKCADGTVYPAAATVQMFVPDPAASMEGCTEGRAFP